MRLRDPRGMEGVRKEPKRIQEGLDASIEQKIVLGFNWEPVVLGQISMNGAIC